MSDEKMSIEYNMLKLMIETTHTELEKRISELEEYWTRQQEQLDNLERKLSGPEVDNQTVKVYIYSDINPDDIKKEIAELREKVDGIYKSVHGIEPNDADTIWANLEINKNGIKRLNEQLNELKKASGGEKDVSEVDESGGDCFRLTNREDTSTHLSDDSKPPEPKKKLMVIMDEDTIFDLNEPIDKPREDDHKGCKGCKFLDYECFKDYVQVKREDLQFLIEELEGWLYDRFDGTGLLNNKLKPINRIKEEYNIE